MFFGIIGSPFYALSQFPSFFSSDVTSDSSVAFSLLGPDMAVALTLGSSVLSAFLQVLFDRMATQTFVNLFRKRNNDEEILEKLRRNLKVVGAVLDDAENKQTMNKAVKEWLDDLHDTFYQAEDLLDKINTEALRLKIETEHYQSSTNKVSASACTLSLINDFLNDIMPEVEKIVLRLVDFKQDIQPLGLQIGESKRQSYRPPSTSLVDDTTIVGRDVDREHIIQLLLSEDANGGSITVVPIVGLGGIGKTTLAQMVYKDVRVKNHFSTKAWVCVSEEYDATRITQELLRELNISFSNPGENLNSLQMKLQASLTDKKFLLVLDDVWNSDYHHWDNLRIPFKGGLRGSKIIVTTRDHNVARMMGKERSIHYLDLIVEKDCWLLFEKHAFENKDGNQNPKLEEIGKKIVNKCGGLPLAVKTVAGLLRSKTTKEQWEDVLVSEVWSRTDYQGGILPALRLSYIHLPSHLKRCFAYCAVFHKDYNFRKEEVIQLWLANDLLEHPEDNNRIENIGEKYFHELRMRSLFHQSSDNFFSMHDLVNDLARFVSGKYCLRLEDYLQGHGTIARLNNFSYHSSHTHDTFHTFEFLMEAKNLRTFLPMRMKQILHPSYVLSNKLLHDTLPKFMSLRVLSLSGYCIGKLPDSFSGLKQLRFLDLSTTLIQELPDWICTLYNLQTLLLSNCAKLEELPEDFGKLINLCYLDISGIPLKKMPLQMGKLRNLQVLPTFLVGKDSGSMIEELGKLTKLRGKLLISRLENVCSGRDALMANMKGKKQIEDLTLKWNADIPNSQVAREVLDNLQPHSSIKHLKIDGYCGTTFANWLGNPSFCHLESLSLSNCQYCFCLPALGQLQSLQSLEIVGMRNVSALTEELYGDTSVMKPFLSLKRFRIEKMPEWEKWHLPECEVFCSLEQLCIIDCPKLTGELPKQLLSLRRLKICGCDKLVLRNGRLSIFKEDIQQLSSLCELKISALMNLKELPTGLNKLSRLECIDCINLKLESESYRSGSLLEELTFRNCDSLKVVSLGSFPMLKRFEIRDCKSIEILSIPPDGIGNQSGILTSLRSLYIFGCDELMFFPEGGLPAPNLMQFIVVHCKKLKSLPERMESLLPSLETLSIYYCPEIVCFPEGGLPSSLKYLRIYACEKLMSCRREWGLQRLPSLIYLDIEGVREVESFPEEDWLLPCTLEYLRLVENIKVLNYSGLLQLTNLKELEILYCPLLQSLPNEGLPASLAKLLISDCPLLKPQLEWEKGQDWPKVAHIPCVVIDDELFP